MRKPADQTADMPGQDSFLDIVANMVGILIILVMVVGVRASHVSVELPLAEVSATSKSELDVAQRAGASLESEVHELDAQAKRLEHEVQLRTEERDALATFIARVEEEIERRRAALDVAARSDFDVRRQFGEARSRLESLQQEKQGLSAAPPDVVKVQSLPTPLSKKVHGRELHFQLREGRIKFIPLDELLETFKATARNKAWKLEDRPQMVDTVGPVGGWRLRYQLGRFDIPAEVTRETGHAGAIVQLVKWELLPVSKQLGDPLEAALAPGSELRTVLAASAPKRTTITIWTYPDSFDAFRRIKAELHALGFATAARPLPEDMPIAGSPDGSRSSAQ